LKTRKEKKWGSKKLLSEFPSKDWSRSGFEKLAAEVTGRQEHQAVNITKVEELICSQGDASGTHKSPLEIKQITGIARSSVVMLSD